MATSSTDADPVYVPSHEPEVIAARARVHYRGDDEKVSTARVAWIMRLGVKLESRYSKANELNAMIDMLGKQPSFVIGELAHIFVDSKAGWCFSVALRRPLNVTAMKITSLSLVDAAVRQVGGHNGFDFHVGRLWQGPSVMTIDPYWRDDPI